MTIIESKVTPGGSDTVPYGDSTCEIPYCDHVSGTIEIEGTPSYIRNGEWEAEAFELIYNEHRDSIDVLSDVFRYCDYRASLHPTKPGTYLIKYSV